MARGTDDSAFESMAVAVDVGGAMPMLVQQPSSDVADDPSSWDGETRRIVALRRRSSRRFPYLALAPEHAHLQVRLRRTPTLRCRASTWAHGRVARRQPGQELSTIPYSTHWRIGFTAEADLPTTGPVQYGTSHGGYSYLRHMHIRNSSLRFSTQYTVVSSLFYYAATTYSTG